jgi:ribonucleoside-diphosphate reductase alpha chain
MALQVDTSTWEAGKDYPEWMNEISLSTISKGYLLPGETPRKAYKRVSDTVAARLDRPDLAAKFFKYMWKGWLNLASPVLSNTGTDKGLPISCFGIDTPDSIRGIGLTNAELMRLTSLGGGVGIGLSKIRGRGSKIGNGDLGQSEGVIPWAKIYDSTIIATNQGAVRRGAASVNLDINHPDIKEFLQIRRPKGDPNRQCLNLHQCVVVDDSFMQKIERRDPEAMEVWVEILKARVETGEPYIMFKDNVNNANPPAYIKNNLEVTMTNICSEITLHTDEEHSFICCLSSVNLAKWDEWKNTDLVETAIYFLDGVMEEFLVKTNGKESLIRAHRSAKKGRAIGLGVLGWHTLLQEKKIPFISVAANSLTHQIFSQIKSQADCGASCGDKK